MAPFKINTVDANNILGAPPVNNVPLPTNNVAAESYYDRQDKTRTLDRQDRQQQFEQDKYHSEREVKAMDAMLKDPKNAQAIARAYGVQLTPEIQDMLANPQMAQQMTDALKMAKDSGLDRPESIQEFVTGYITSGGDPLKAMESVTDKSSLKELYYNSRINNQGRHTGGSNPYGGGRVQQPDGRVFDYTKGIIYNPDGSADYMKTPDGQPVIPPRTPADDLGALLRGAGTTTPPIVPPTPSRPAAPPPQAFTDEVTRRAQTTSPQAAPIPAPAPRRTIDREDPFNPGNYSILDNYSD